MIFAGPQHSLCHGSKSKGLRRNEFPCGNGGLNLKHNGEDEHEDDEVGNRKELSSSIKAKTGSTVEVEVEVATVPKLPMIPPNLKTNG